MTLPIYQIDAFSDELFRGNPAAVCPLDAWPESALLQRIAAENNLSETAFFVRQDGEYQIRWFTPTVEVELCGHATLAAAWILFHCLDHGDAPVRFQSDSGPLQVTRDGDWLTMDFPATPASPCSPPEGLLESFHLTPSEILHSVNYLLVFENEDEIRTLTPDLVRLKTITGGAFIVTAPGRNCDFVSRLFAPNYGIDEDPVTGSSHCTLAPYWANKLNKTDFMARQISTRGGTLHCKLAGDRVLISGQAVLYLEGRIHIAESTDQL